MAAAMGRQQRHLLEAVVGDWLWAAVVSGSAVVLVLDLNDGNCLGSGGRRRLADDSGSRNGGWWLRENGGGNISVCGSSGKIRERRIKKTISSAPPIFVSEATSPMKIGHVYSSVTWCH
jgi:hypothetical protein